MVFFKRIQILFIGVFILLLFKGCSWTSHFYIVNLTDQDLTVEIILSEEEMMFPIFYYSSRNFGRHQLFELNPKKKIDRTTKKEIEVDTLANFAHCQINLPPNTAFEFGVLNNDKYESYDQEFINNRVFNLKRLRFSNGKDGITPQNFDKNSEIIDGSVVVKVE